MESRDTNIAHDAPLDTSSSQRLEVAKRRPVEASARTRSEETGLSPADSDVWVIEPRSGSIPSQLTQLWDYRYLFRFFGRRALQKRYARTVLGMWWLLIRPLFPILIGVFVFGGVMGVNSGELPYFLFITVGTAYWRTFSSSFMWGTRSLELNRGVMKQLYFPRIILPMATMLPSGVELLIYSGVLSVAVVYYAIVDGIVYLHFGWNLLMAPVAIFFTFLFSLALSLFTSIFGARTRDLRFSLGYVNTFWMFLTPVIYPMSYVPAEWRWAMYFNPLAALVETFRWSLFGVGQLDLTGLGVSVAIIFALLFAGLSFFHNADATAVDRL